MNLTWKSGLGIAVVAILLTAAYGGMVIGFFIPPPVPPVGPTTNIHPNTEYSTFKWTGICEDATTSVTGASSRVFFDINFDGVMQYSELSTFTEASGVYTSDKEYPINYLDSNGVLYVYDLWVQSYAATYQLTYALFHMTGARYAGEVKSVGNLEHRLTDDSITWSGEMNDADFDTTDYNATLSGLTGTLEAKATLSAADYGLSSQVWEGIDYKKAYGIDKLYPYYVRWDAIGQGTNDAIAIAPASVMAGTFFCAYLTTQDSIDGQVNIANFDYSYPRGTDTYCIDFLDASYGDLMYNTADATAPRIVKEFGMGSISGVGTFYATYGVGIWQGVTYDEMMSGAWTKGTDLALGTCGDGWGWALGAASAP